MIFNFILFALTLSTLSWITFFGQSYGQVTWNTFEEKDGLFSIQIPSNWNEEELPEAEKLSPIEYLFRYADKGNSFAWLELMISKPPYLDARSVADSYISYYQQFGDFNLLNSTECNSYKLNDVSACSIMSSQQLEGEQRRNVLNVVSVTPDGVQTDVIFITSNNIFDTFLPIGEYIIKSLDMNSTRVNEVLDNQTIENLESEIPVIPTQNTTTQEFEIPVIPTQNTTTPQQQLQEQPFRSIYDTFVTSEPQRFGIYDKKMSNTFRPGETIILYIEPAGFEYGTQTDDGNNTLYTIDFTADFAISDTEGNVLTKQQGLLVSDIVTHSQNKEVFIPFTITQTSPFPPGNYIITYTIHDENSGKSFDIVKEVVISETLLA